jgi:hypothetical protein
LCASDYTIFKNYKPVKELGHLHLQTAELWLINCGLHIPWSQIVIKRFTRGTLLYVPQGRHQRSERALAR